MGFKNTLRLVVVFLFVWVTLSLAIFVVQTPHNVRAGGWAYAKAATADLFFLKNLPIELVLEREDEEMIKEVPARKLKELTAPLWKDAKREFFGDAFLAFFAAGFVVVALVVYQTRHGKKIAEDEFLRGAKLVSEKQLAQMVEEPSGFRVGSVGTPKRMLLRNALFTGSMGTGKSQALSYWLDEARRLGELGQPLKVIVYDKTGEFCNQFFREGKDILLNPFDQRCAPWSIFKDIQQDFDYSTLSTFFIPENKQATDQVWDNASRILLEDVLRICHSGPPEKQNAAAVQDIIFRMPLDKLAELLRAHGAASSGTITEKNERASESVRLTLSASPSLKYWGYLPIPTPENEFSIREWVRQENDSWLFLTSRSDMHEAIKPFASLWVELVLMSVMTLRPDHTKLRAMIFLDELPSLNRMRSLEVCVQEGRKYGICTVAGLQNLSSLDHLYGQEMSKVIVGNFQTQYILRVTDESTARRYADSLGKQEIIESSEGLSFGENSARDGASLNSARKEVHLVTASEISTLPDLTGYLKLPGDLPIAKVKIIPKDRPTIAPDFISRGGLEVGRAAKSQPSTPGLHEKIEVNESLVVPDTPPEPVIKKRNRAAARIEKAGYTLDEIPRESIDSIASDDAPPIVEDGQIEQSQKVKLSDL